VESYLSYWGRSSCLSKQRKKSAEVIVVVGNEPCPREQHGGLTKQRRTKR
jgi:hypothetical protein